MEYAVLLRVDAAGKCPVIAGPDTDLSGEDGARWRLIAETDDKREAFRLLCALHDKIVRGEVSRRKAPAVLRDADVQATRPASRDTLRCPVR
jgi:hypothetical protein